MVPVRASVNQDVMAGLLFVLFGAAGLWFGREYEGGTALQMGPGYVPRILSWGLIVFGIGISIKGFLTGGDKLASPAIRPLACVLGSFVVFGLLIERAGLPLAAVACVLVGAFGGSSFRWRDQLILSISLAIGITALFVHALGVPMRVWPW